MAKITVDLDKLQYGGGCIDVDTRDAIVTVLLEKQPKNILEFGLGTSSIILHNYAKNTGSKCMTIEGQSSWIKAMSRHIEEQKMNVKLCNDHEITFNGATTIIPLGWRQEVVSNYPFDFVFLDGPIGWPYSWPRTQILGVVPYLDPNGFVIIVHDSDRPGDRNTILALLELLGEYGFRFTVKDAFKQQQSHLIINGRK